MHGATPQNGITNITKTDPPKARVAPVIRRYTLPSSSLPLNPGAEPDSPAVMQLHHWFHEAMCKKLGALGRDDCVHFADDMEAGGVDGGVVEWVEGRGDGLETRKHYREAKRPMINLMAAHARLEMWSLQECGQQRGHSGTCSVTDKK